HGGKEEGDCHRHARVIGHSTRADPTRRMHLCSAESKAHGIHRWQPERSRGKAAGETASRGARSLVVFTKMKILVITEQREGKWNAVSSETLVAAQQIAAAQSGSRVAAAVIGKGVRGLAEEVAANQLAEILLVEHDLLERYTPDGFAIALRQAITQNKPDLVLLPHTYQV